MRVIKQLALVVSTILVGAAVQVAPAAAGPPGSTAGVSTSTGSSASYQRFTGDLPEINIGVSESTDTFDPQSGPRITTTQSQLFVSVFTGDDFFQCFVPNPTGFVLSSDLSTASVHFTIPEGTEDCITSFSVTFPQTIDVTWTGVGPVNTFQSTGRSMCPGFNIETSISNFNRTSSATASVTPLLADTFPATQASLGSGDNRTQIQGSMPPLCEATGGGKGAGPGPVGPGTYRLTSSGASQQLSNATTGDAIQVLAGVVTSSSNPRSGPSSSSTDSTFRLRMFSPSFVDGCFVMSPDALSINSNVTAASLHVALTEETATCDSSPSLIPLPLTIDVTWTGIGPTTSNRTNSISNCGGYRSELSVASLFNNSSAVATLSGAIEESFVSTQSEFESTGSFGNFDQTIQVQGSPAGCGF